MGRGGTDQILYGDSPSPTRAVEKIKPLVIPSLIARALAGKLWPDVQTRTKLAEGIFHFTSAGHGGMIAVVGVADLPPAALAAARANNLIEAVAVVSRAGKHTLYTTEEYALSALEELVERECRAPGGSAQLIDVWTGEEDCAWATIALAQPEVRKAMVTKLGFSENAASYESVRGVVERWYPEMLPALGG